MNKSRIIKRMAGIMMLSVVSVSMLNGCQLATNEGKGSKAEAKKSDSENRDMFIGVFFSTEDLFADVSGDKIYAKKSVYGEGSEKVYTNFTFEDPDGIGEYHYFAMKEDGTALYNGSAADGTDCGAAYFPWGIHLAEGEKTEQTSKGTIKVNKLNLNKLSDRINVYAVYQTRECEVYMTPSSFFDAKDGAKFSMTDTSKIKEEEGEIEYSCSIEATIETVTPPEKTVLHQIDSNNKSIGVVEIDNSNIPESVELESETEYVIVEEYIGQDITNRYMVDMKFDEEIELYDPELEEEDEENTDCIFVADRDEEELFMNEAMVELKKKLY